MRSILIFIHLLAVAMLQGCSDKSDGTPAAESNKVTQTRMNDIDSLEGTISDEMIISDDATDEAALEPEKATATETKNLSGKPETKPATPKPATPKPAAESETSSETAQ